MSGRRHALVALACVAVVGAMGGLTAASVPLYELFCRVTGYGGTPQRVAEAGARRDATEVTVYFNADKAADLPWRFQPVQRQMVVRLGEENLAFFRAANTSAQPVVGTATFNVTPFKVGPYFSKIQCFCFDQQTLAAGETVDMPVSFYVDPAILDDPSTRDVRQITLSYTFFLDAESTAALAHRSAPAEDGAS